MILETERLYLEPFSERHLEGLFLLDSDPEVMRYLGPLKTREETKAAIARVEERWVRLGYGWWALIEKTSSKIVGAVCVQNTANVEGAPLEIGWRLALSAQGKGYATEAGEAVMNFAFDRLRVDFVVALAVQENTPSLKVMQRLGMSYHGIETYYDIPHIAYMKKRV